MNANALCLSSCAITLLLQFTYKYRYCKVLAAIQNVHTVSVTVSIMLSTKLVSIKHRYENEKKSLQIC